MNTNSFIYPVFRGRTSQKVTLGPLTDPIRETVTRAFAQAEHIYQRRVQWFELPKVLRYGPGNHYGTHADNCFREKHQDFWTKGIGGLLLFPSDNHYKHGANPVSSGVRYVIVSWDAYADEPKVHATPPGAVVPMPQTTHRDKENR